MPASIGSVIFCDDVRKEISGKDIIIGVYNGDILVPSYPIAMNLAFWVEVENVVVGRLPFEGRIALPTGNNREVEVAGHLDITEEGTATIVLNVGVLMQHDGDVVLRLRVGEDDLREVKRKRVRIP